MTQERRFCNSRRIISEGLVEFTLALRSSARFSPVSVSIIRRRDKWRSLGRRVHILGRPFGRKVIHLPSSLNPPSRASEAR